MKHNNDISTPTQVEAESGPNQSVAADDRLATEDPMTSSAPAALSLVISVICLRYAVEIALGVVAKNLYKGYSRNVAGNLFLELTVFFPLCYSINWLNNKGVPIASRAFGGKWTFSWHAFKLLAAPAIFWCLQILFKQTLVRNTGGPGYAEMLTGISIIIGSVVQYYINGIKVGKLGLAAALLCMITSMIAGYIVGNFWIGCVCATFNVCRSALMKKTNKSLKQPAALNLLYCELIALPILLVMMIINEKSYEGPTTVMARGLEDRITGVLGQYEVSGMFKNYFGCIPFFRPVSLGFIFFSLASNILVLTIYDLCSPVTYLVASQMKGVVQTAADIFYVDYIVVLAINFLASLFSVDELIDAENIKNHNELTSATFIAFTIKTFAALLYISEKAYFRRRVKKFEQARLAGMDEAQVVTTEEKR